MPALTDDVETEITLNTEELKADVMQRLTSVDDPCSMATAMPINIVDLGLVRDVTVEDDGSVRVVISPTSPGCMVLPRIAEAVHDAAAGAPGATSVDVSVDFGFTWSQAAMAPSARQALTARREGIVRDLGLQPQQWKRTRTSFAQS